MNVQVIVLATVTGLVAGVIFGFFDVPIPAPPNAAGIMGIVGIFVGYRVVDHLGVGVNLLDALGL